jgi:hypothetical protein
MNCCVDTLSPTPHVASLEAGHRHVDVKHSHHSGLEEVLKTFSLLLATARHACVCVAGFTIT